MQTLRNARAHDDDDDESRKKRFPWSESSLGPPRYETDIYAIVPSYIFFSLLDLDIIAFGSLSISLGSLRGGWLWPSAELKWTMG